MTSILIRCFVWLFNKNSFITTSNFPVILDGQFYSYIIFTKRYKPNTANSQPQFSTILSLQHSEILLPLPSTAQAMKSALLETRTSPPHNPWPESRLLPKYGLVRDDVTTGRAWDDLQQHTHTTSKNCLQSQLGRALQWNVTWISFCCLECRQNIKFTPPLGYQDNRRGVHLKLYNTWM
jgi:hypothetical protein